MRTHQVYEFDVEFTQLIDHRDQCGDHTHNSKRPGTKSTVRIVMEEYREDIAEALCRSYFKHSEDFKIHARRKHDVNVMLSI